MSNSARIDELRIKFEDNNRRYFAPLANEYRKAGDLEQAIALCREHLPQQPGHMSGYIVFGQALYEAGELTEAESVFTQALELDPENLIALRHLGDIARAANDNLTAERWYGRALDADPRNDDIAAQLASLVSARVATPKSTPVLSSNQDTNRTPAFGMPFGGFGAMPTPDAAMRSIDPDAVTKQARSYEPLDIDELGGIDGSPAQALAPVVPAAPEAEAPVLHHSDVVAANVHDDNHGANTGHVASEGADDAPLVDDDADPFAYPIEREIARQPRDSGAFDRISTADDSAELAVSQTAESSEADEFETFEAGLLAPQWPDTSDLVMRVVHPRTPTPASFTPSSLTPVSTSAYEDAPAAFGREATDPQGVPAINVEATSDDVDAIEPDREPSDAVAASADIDTIEPDREPLDAVAASADVDAIAADADALDTVSAAATTSSTELNYLISADEFAEDDAEDDAVDDVEHLTVEMTNSDADHASEDEPDESAGTSTAAVLSDAAHDDSNVVDDIESEIDGQNRAEFTDEPATDSASDFDEISAAMASDAAAAGDDSTVYVAERDGNDEHPSDFVARPTPVAGSTAFVTETMAELLVSQGFTGRAVEVYQELVRRRPYDPVLTSRLQQLTESMQAEQADTETIAPAHTAFENVADAHTDSVADSGSADTTFTDVWSRDGDDQRIADDFADAIIEQRLTPVSNAAMSTPRHVTPAFNAARPTPTHFTPVFNAAVPTPTYFTPAFTTPFSQPSVAAESDPHDARPTARDVFAALASRRVPRRTPSQSFTVVAERADGLASLFGNDSSHTEDAAARALADAFAPVSDDDYGEPSTLEFELNRSTPAYSHLVTPSDAQPAVSSTPTPSYGQTHTPASSNEGFSFDRFFPDPASRHGTPASSSPATSASPTPVDSSPAAMDPPVADDLAQFSQWLKGLNKP